MFEFYHQFDFDLNLIITELAPETYGVALAILQSVYNLLVRFNFKLHRHKL